MDTTNTMTAGLTGGTQIPLGAHLVTPRRGYTHHGIYVGNGRVVHYMGLSVAWRRGPVAEVTLEQFGAGREVSIEAEACAAYTPIEVVQRAQSRVGEDAYDMLTNNCEHLCTWCAHGVSRSAQVDRLLAWPRRIAQDALSLFGTVFATTAARRA
ncbi:lecithin retinol acyltransferase family protein [Caldimonas sp. KR1-144]|uniref:lecithin retinol acyltransferase family protein n=1 Tax=Caldimonas sp. KR1-144 TaxID=3400911 RepID=UPI003C03502A